MFCYAMKRKVLLNRTQLAFKVVNVFHYLVHTFELLHGCVELLVGGCAEGRLQHLRRDARPVQLVRAVQHLLHIVLQLSIRN